MSTRNGYAGRLLSILALIVLAEIAKEIEAASSSNEYNALYLRNL